MKPIPTLTGKTAKRFLEMAEANEKEFKGFKECDTVKKVMYKQQQYLEKSNIADFKLKVYTKEELKAKRSKAWKPIV
jgi:hypothetical protein